MDFRVWVMDNYGFIRKAFDTKAGPQVVDLVLEVQTRCNIRDVNQIIFVRYLTNSNETMKVMFSDNVAKRWSQGIRQLEIFVDFKETSRVMFTNFDMTERKFLSYKSPVTPFEIVHDAHVRFNCTMHQIYSVDSVSYDGVIEPLTANDNETFLQKSFVIVRMEWRKDIPSWLTPWTKLPSKFEKDDLSTVFDSKDIPFVKRGTRPLNQKKICSSASFMAERLMTSNVSRMPFKSEIEMYLNHLFGPHPFAKPDVYKKDDYKLIAECCVYLQKMGELNRRYDMEESIKPLRSRNPLPLEILPDCWLTHRGLRKHVTAKFEGEPSKLNAICRNFIINEDTTVLELGRMFQRKIRFNVLENLEKVYFDTVAHNEVVSLNQKVELGKLYCFRQKAKKKTCLIFNQDLELVYNLSFDSHSIFVSDLFHKVAATMDCDYDNVRWVTTVNDSGGLVLLSSSDFLSGIKTVFVKVYLGEHQDYNRAQQYQLPLQFRKSLTEVIKDEVMMERIKNDEEKLSSTDLYEIALKMAKTLYNLYGRDVWDKEWLHFRSFVMKDFDKLDDLLCDNYKCIAGVLHDYYTIAWSDLYKDLCRQRAACVKAHLPSTMTFDFDEKLFMSQDSYFSCSDLSSDGVKTETPENQIMIYIIDHENLFVGQFSGFNFWQCSLVQTKVKEKFGIGDHQIISVKILKDEQFKKFKLDTNDLIGHADVFVQIFKSECPILNFAEQNFIVLPPDLRDVTLQKCGYKVRKFNGLKKQLNEGDLTNKDRLDVFEKLLQKYVSLTSKIHLNDHNVRLYIANVFQDFPNFKINSFFDDVTSARGEVTSCMDYVTKKIKNYNSKELMLTIRGILTGSAPHFFYAKFTNTANMVKYYDVETNEWTEELTYGLGFVRKRKNKDQCRPVHNDNLDPQTQQLLPKPKIVVNRPKLITIFKKELFYQEEENADEEDMENLNPLLEDLDLNMAPCSSRSLIRNATESGESTPANSQQSSIILDDDSSIASVEDLPTTTTSSNSSPPKESQQSAASTASNDVIQLPSSSSSRSSSLVKRPYSVDLTNTRLINEIEAVKNKTAQLLTDEDELVVVDDGVIEQPRVSDHWQPWFPRQARRKTINYRDYSDSEDRELSIAVNKPRRSVPNVNYALQSEEQVLKDHQNVTGQKRRRRSRSSVEKKEKRPKRTSRSNEKAPDTELSAQLEHVALEVPETPFKRSNESAGTSKINGGSGGSNSEASNSGSTRSKKSDRRNSLLSDSFSKKNKRLSGRLKNSDGSSTVITNEAVESSLPGIRESPSLETNEVHVVQEPLVTDDEREVIDLGATEEQGVVPLITDDERENLVETTDSQREDDVDTVDNDEIIPFEINKDERAGTPTVDENSDHVEVPRSQSTPTPKKLLCEREVPKVVEEDDDLEVIMVTKRKSLPLHQELTIIVVSNYNKPLAKLMEMGSPTEKQVKWYVGQRLKLNKRRIQFVKAIHKRKLVDVKEEDYNSQFLVVINVNKEVVPDFKDTVNFLPTALTEIGHLQILGLPGLTATELLGLFHLCRFEEKKNYYKTVIQFLTHRLVKRAPSENETKLFLAHTFKGFASMADTSQFDLKQLIDECWQRYCEDRRRVALLFINSENGLEDTWTPDSIPLHSESTIVSDLARESFDATILIPTHIITQLNNQNVGDDIIIDDTINNATNTTSR